MRESTDQIRRPIYLFISNTFKHSRNLSVFWLSWWSLISSSFPIKRFIAFSSNVLWSLNWKKRIHKLNFSQLTKNLLQLFLRRNANLIKFKDIFLVFLVNCWLLRATSGLGWRLICWNKRKFYGNWWESIVCHRRGYWWWTLSTR